MLEQEYPKVSDKDCPQCGKPLIRDEEEAWCHGRCDFGPKSHDSVKSPEIWEREPNDDHAWAFIHYCRRQGDDVNVLKHKDDTITIVVDEHNQAAKETGPVPK